MSQDQNPQSSSSSTSFSIDFLCKLIPQEFNGNRYELGQFIANCNNAIELATESQKTPLIIFYTCKNLGKSKRAIGSTNLSRLGRIKN